MIYGKAENNWFIKKSGQLFTKPSKIIKEIGGWKKVRKRIWLKSGNF